MINRFKKHLSQLNKNNKGMSIATVIIAIGFVLVLISIILSTSTINFKMRNMSVYSKDAFYSAEQVLDELNVGLQQMVQDGLSQAYISVLTDYGNEDLTSKDKNELVKGEFYDYMIERLGLNENSTTQYVAMQTNYAEGSVPVGLYALIKESTRWHGTTVDNSYGAFLRAADDGYTSDKDGNQVYIGKMQMTNDDGIYLRDLVIYYRDENGFTSTIKTDIHLVYPGFKFANPNMPDINSYAFITDTKFDTTGTNNNKTIKVTGNSFAYTVDTKKTVFDYIESTTTPDIHIVEEAFNIDKGGITTYDRTELWAQDINSESSVITLGGNTYVRDDLNLTGKNNQVKITGMYTGFGKSVKDPEDSSAILVNGQDTVIDLEFVKRISLAGRSFVGINNKNANSKVQVNGKDKDEDADDPSLSEKISLFYTGKFYTGESVSAKSNQLLYLVPGECIGVNQDNESMFNKNPLTAEEYEILIEKMKENTEDKYYQWVAFNKPIPKLGSTGNTLGLYLDEDVKKSIKVVPMRTVGGGDNKQYFWFYMNFTDENTANTYFAKYYNLNKDAVDKYMDKYIDLITFPDKSQVSLKVSMAANAIKDEGTGEDKVRSIASYIRVPDGEAAISDSFEDEYKSYVNMFEGYCTFLSPDLATLEDEGYIVHEFWKDNDETKNKKLEYVNKIRDQKGELIKYTNSALFSNLVNKESFEEIIDGNGVFSFKDPADDSKNRVLLIHRPDVEDVYQVTANDLKNCNLIIADCSLDLNQGSSFEGCIIARGSIKVSKDFEFVANSKKVGECLNMTTEDDVYSVYEVFEDADDLAFLSKEDNKSSMYKIEDLVEFSGWSKNINIK